MSHFGVESRNADGTIVFRGGYSSPSLEAQRKREMEERAKKHDPNAPVGGLEAIFQFLHQIFSRLFFSMGNHEKDKEVANTASFLIRSGLLNEDNFSSSNPFDQMNKIMVNTTTDTISLLRYGKDSDIVFYDSQRFSSAANRRREEELTSNKENTTTTSKGIDKEELAKAVLDSNLTKTATHTNNSFGMMND